MNCNFFCPYAAFFFVLDACVIFCSVVSSLQRFTTELSLAYALYCCLWHCHLPSRAVLASAPLGLGVPLGLPLPRYQQCHVHCRVWPHARHHLRSGRFCDCNACLLLAAHRFANRWRLCHHHRSRLITIQRLEPIQPIQHKEALWTRHDFTSTIRKNRYYYHIVC